MWLGLLGRLHSSFNLLGTFLNSFNSCLGGGFYSLLGIGCNLLHLGGGLLNLLLHGFGLSLAASNEKSCHSGEHCELLDHDDCTFW